jgi:predicted DNA-binding ribbon-helix-helix protein
VVVDWNMLVMVLK